MNKEEKMAVKASKNTVIEKATSFDTFGEALYEMSDIMLCFANDFHLMHLLVKGSEFDVLHKDVLKKYYEEAGNDYDELAEWAVGLGVKVDTGSESCKRMDFAPLHYKEDLDKELVVSETMDMMSQIIAGFNVLLQSCYDECGISQGIANYIQGRMEYWAKEYMFFNKRRGQ